MSLSVNVSVEAVQEYQVQEITYDGQEIYAQPLSMSENLTKLAHKIDFGKTDGTSEPDAPEEEGKELAPFQASLWPWDSVRTKLRTMLSEVSVLVDVLNIAKDKHYMVMDPVSQDPPEPKPLVVLLQKKKSLAGAANIILTGAERLRISQCEPSRNRTVSDFHLELLHMRQYFRLKKTGNAILGDLSFKSAGSRYTQSGMFEVTKNEQSETPAPIMSPSPGTSLPPRYQVVKVTLPNELEGISFVHVSIHNDVENIANGEVAIPLPPGMTVPIDPHWQQKLEAAQNVIFCKELFFQLAREAIQMQATVPNLVVGNQITASLFPGVYLTIGLCHTTATDRPKSVVVPRRGEHKPVLEHSLHQFLREMHYNSIHHLMPHPVTSVLGVTKKRRLAGAEASDLHTILECGKSEMLLERIIRQARHDVLRLRTMHVIDSFACDIKDPLIVAHWVCLSSSTLTSVKINIMTHGYETICRTPLVVHIEEKSLKAICRDGRSMALSFDVEELRFLLMCQVSQHQVNAAQALAKLMGWKVLSTSNHIGVGPVETIGNASSVLMASPTGDRAIAIRCGPESGVNVSVSYSPQQQDFYPSTLVRDRKWQNLSGSFREVCWDKMEGRNFLNKLEHLMASLTPC